MSLQGYLLGLKISTLFAFFAWASVVLYIDPEAAGIFGKILFFSTFFLWIAGFCTLLLTVLGRWMQGDEYAARMLGPSMRRSIFISIAISASLFLQYLAIIAPWNVLLIITACLLIELYFLHTATKHDKESQTQTTATQKYSRLKHKK